MMTLKLVFCNREREVLSLCQERDLLLLLTFYLMKSFMCSLLYWERLLLL